MATFRLKRPDSENETAIKMYCYINNEIIAIYTRQTIHPNFWLGDKQKATEDRKVFKHGRKINFELERLESIQKSMMVSIQNNREKVSVKNFRAIFEEKAFGIKPKRKHTKNTRRLSGTAFFINFDNFIEFSDVSEARREHFAVVKRMLLRYEMYVGIVTEKRFKLSLDTISGDTIRDFVNFIKIENEICTDFPKLYEKFPEKRKPRQRGNNRIIGIVKIIRTFILYCDKNGIDAKNPFKTRVDKILIEGEEVAVILTGYVVGAENYGDPIYLTIKERNILYYLDLSAHPFLAIQRDIFIFQCQVGCRVGDLYKFTYANIVNGVLHFIAGKTQDEHPVTLTVPLNSTALELIAKYKNRKGDERLFPYISEKGYNEDLKDVFKLAGLTRNVVVLDSITGEVAMSTLDKEASSHMARRTFIGNLYNKVQDPNLISSMTGHTEGSKAFKRYRNIDDDLKMKTLELLE
jgi:hypothetical protein